jgi:hypothetical protein
MKFDPFDIREQQRADADARHEASLERRNTAENWAWLMSSKRGRALMRDVLTFCGVYRSSFTGNSETYFREGQRNVGLYFLSQIQEHAPEHYIEMIKESRNA